MARKAYWCYSVNESRHVVGEPFCTRYFQLAANFWARWCQWSLVCSVMSSRVHSEAYLVRITKSRDGGCWLQSKRCTALQCRAVISRRSSTTSMRISVAILITAWLAWVGGVSREMLMTGFTAPAADSVHKKPTWHHPLSWQPHPNTASRAVIVTQRL